MENNTKGVTIEEASEFGHQPISMGDVPLGLMVAWPQAPFEEAWFKVKPHIGENTTGKPMVITHVPNGEIPNFEAAFREMGTNIPVLIIVEDEAKDIINGMGKGLEPIPIETIPLIDDSIEFNLRRDNILKSGKEMRRDRRKQMRKNFNT